VLALRCCRWERAARLGESAAQPWSCRQTRGTKRVNYAESLDMYVLSYYICVYIYHIYIAADGSARLALAGQRHSHGRAARRVGPKEPVALRGYQRHPLSCAESLDIFLYHIIYVYIYHRVNP